MTEQEWAIVTLAFTNLFDTVKELAPERINKDRVFTAGKILQQEQNRIRARQFFWLNAATEAAELSWQKKNAELERKKEAQHLQELGDLTQALKLSIEKAEKDRQGE